MELYSSNLDLVDYTKFYGLVSRGTVCHFMFSNNCLFAV